MTSLTTPGNIAGLVLLAAGIVAVVARATASRLAESRSARAAPAYHGQHPLAQRVPAQLVPVQRVAPRASVVAIPAQSTWQSRAGHAPRVHDLASNGPGG
jgi:hypothetical protein